MAPQRTPRHRAGAPAEVPRSRPVSEASRRERSSSTVPAPGSARRRGGPFARHLRSGPRVAVTSGVAAALLLGPPLGVTVATATGELRPEHVGPLGPVVAALPWQGTDPASWLDGRDPRDDRSSRTLADGRSADGLEHPSDTSAEPTAPSAPDTPPDGAEQAEPGGADDGAEPAPASPEPTQPGPGDAQADPAPSGEAADPAPSVTPAPTAAVQVGPGAISAEGAAVVERTNAERAAAGCGPLVVDERLTAAAQLHSEDMLAQGYFDHTSLDGRSPWDRAKAQGYANPGAENIAKGQATAEDVVRAWMESPGHRANILNCDLREIGVGHADRVWTQLFGWG
ncbi:CAP domain-containing protein [Cellulosimicrobium sp. SH8]|uniref:CAP domain-containing protein n=1 Tax=Cellulosimicrobium sp. SH8 TaxID=2952936 RepID=UPI0021F3BA6E|nr:CAP domain-containing protein [Cellulosimicrobium sp. SH8]